METLGYLGFRCPVCKTPLRVTEPAVYDPDHPPTLGEGAAKVFSLPCGVCQETRTFTREQVEWFLMSEP